MNPELINAVAEKLSAVPLKDVKRAFLCDGHSNVMTIRTNDFSAMAKAAIKTVIESEDYQQLLKDLDWSQRQYQSDQETIHHLQSQLRERELQYASLSSWLQRRL